MLTKTMSSKELYDVIMRSYDHDVIIIHYVVSSERTLFTCSGCLTKFIKNSRLAEQQVTAMG